MKKEIISELERKMSSACELVHKDFSGLRTGRASAALLESIQVEAYGNKVPLNQVGNVNVPEPRLLTIQIWDESMAPMVEKAVRESGLGLNPVTAGNIVRVPVPELSEERRHELSKVASKYAENGRVAIRNVRRDGMDKIKALEKEGDLSEDEAHKLHDDVQKLTDQYIKKVDESLSTKEKDIMQV